MAKNCTVYFIQSFKQSRIFIWRVLFLRYRGEREISEVSEN